MQSSIRQLSSLGELKGGKGLDAGEDTKGAVYKTQWGLDGDSRGAFKTIFGYLKTRLMPYPYQETPAHTGMPV